MTTPNPQDDATLDEILLHYRSMIADLVEDRHDRGVTTEQLKSLDDEAKARIQAIVRAEKSKFAQSLLEQKQEAIIYNTNPKTKVMRWYSRAAEAVPVSVIEAAIKEMKA